MSERTRLLNSSTEPKNEREGSRWRNGLDLIPSKVSTECDGGVDTACHVPVRRAQETPSREPCFRKTLASASHLANKQKRESQEPVSLRLLLAGQGGGRTGSLTQHLRKRSPACPWRTFGISEKN